MPERYYQRQRQREFVKAAQAAGNEVVLRGFPVAITIPRAQAPTQDNVKFVWLRRPGGKGAEAGLTKKQLRMISILQAIGLGKMVVKL